MDPDMCKTITQKGMLEKPDGSHFWTLQEMKTEWDILDETRQEPKSSTATTPLKPSSSKKGKKRKAIVGGPGDEMVEDPVEKDKGKTKTKVVQLTS